MSGRPGGIHTATPALSSVRSLGLQGGPMSPDEVEAFERRPHHEAAVLVRRWDDRAKVAGLAVAPFEDYRPLLLGLVARL